MTKHGHRSVKRSNDFNRMQNGNEQKYILNQTAIDRKVHGAEKDETVQYKKSGNK